MATVETGLGGEVSLGVGALIVAVMSSVIMLAFLLVIGQDVRTSLVEVVTGGVVVGIAFYLGLRFQS